MLVAGTAPERGTAEVPVQCGLIKVLEAQIDRTARHSAGAPYNRSTRDHGATEGAVSCRMSGLGSWPALADPSGLTDAFGEALPGCGNAARAPTRDGRWLTSRCCAAETAGAG
jgi:hypothetical protein